MNTPATSSVETTHPIDLQDEIPARVLDPVSRVSEIIFGLLMAMTFTGTLSVATAGREEVRTMLLTAIGCNLAWGLADAVMYLVQTATARARARSMLEKVRASNEAESGQQLIAEAMPSGIVRALGSDGLEFLRQRLLSIPDQAPKAILGRRDFLAAAGVFTLVVLATFPVVIPFLLFDETGFALRMSNVLGLSMLFLGGGALATYAGSQYWKGGLALLVTGGVLNVAIILLGG